MHSGRVWEEIAVPDGRDELDYLAFIHGSLKSKSNFVSSSNLLHKYPDNSGTWSLVLTRKKFFPDISLNDLDSEMSAASVSRNVILDMNKLEPSDFEILNKSLLHMKPDPTCVNVRNFAVDFFRIPDALRALYGGYLFGVFSSQNSLTRFLAERTTLKPRTAFDGIHAFTKYLSSKVNKSKDYVSVSSLPIEDFTRHYEVRIGVHMAPQDTYGLLVCTCAGILQSRSSGACVC
jgi:hypothetical protein